MALRTLGTSATTSLSAQLFTRQMAAVDVASIRAGIKDDQTNTYPIYPGSFGQGCLYIPNRGILRPLPGDYIAFDATTGWPILLSALAIASGPYSHS
jgi:hypothetical protein